MQERSVTFHMIRLDGESVIFCRSLPSPPAFPARFGLTEATANSDCAWLARVIDSSADTRIAVRFIGALPRFLFPVHHHAGRRFEFDLVSGRWLEQVGP